MPRKSSHQMRPSEIVMDEFAGELIPWDLDEHLNARLETAPPPMPRLHPNLAELYRQKVMNLAQSLNEEHTRLEAVECIRELIEEIRLLPDNGKLRVELYGELAALIKLANEHHAIL
jgi:hypothetical protein